MPGDEAGKHLKVRAGSPEDGSDLPQVGPGTAGRGSTHRLPGVCTYPLNPGRQAHQVQRAAVISIPEGVNDRGTPGSAGRCFPGVTSGVTLPRPLLCIRGLRELGTASWQATGLKGVDSAHSGTCSTGGWCVP